MLKPTVGLCTRGFDSRINMWVIFNRFEREAEKMGLEINEGKTKYM